MKWRLVCTRHNSGAWNMAVDEAIMMNVAKGVVPPYLSTVWLGSSCIVSGRLQSSRGMSILKVVRI